MPGLSDEISWAETTVLRLAEPFCQQHHISADRRDVNVIGLVIAFDFIEIFAVRVTLGRDSNFQQMPKVFHRAGFVFSGVFDPRSFFDLNHPTSNLFLHYLLATDSAMFLYKMSATRKRSMNTTSKIGKSFQKPDKHGVAGVETLARLPALHVPPTFIRRCGEKK